MDEVKIEIKDEFIHQDEDLQTKKKSIASSSKEITNVLNEEFHIKNEPIGQRFILPSTDQENTLVKSETIEMKTDLKTEVKQENFGEFEACEQVGIDLIRNKDFGYPFVTKSALIKMKTELKTEVNVEPFEKFEAREEGGIDFITSKDLDQNVNESELPTNKLGKQAKNISSAHQKTFQMHHIDKGDITERSTDKRLQCDACNSFFKTKTNLKAHIELVHEGKKPFRCIICEASFAQNAHLKRHV